MSNVRTYVIADLHLGHKNILQYEPLRSVFPTIEAHNYAILHRWNSTVRPSDIVWVLGDVCFGSESFGVVAQFHGIKRLVMGNHDNYSMQRYLEVFHSVHGVAEYRGCVLTHMPVHEGQKARYRANIHGHLHSKRVDDPWYVCVSAEQLDLTPINIKQVIPL